MIKKRIISKNKKTNPIRKKINWGKIIFRLVFLAFWGVVFYVLFLSGKLSANSINISGIKTLDQAKILDEVNSQISGKYGGIIDRNNLIIIRSGKIEKMLMADFKRIKKAEVRKKFPNSINVDIFERKLSLLFCGNGPCFFLDESGDAYELADPDNLNPEEKQIPILKDNSGKDAYEGENVFDSQYINYISEIAPELKSNMDIDLENNYETPSRVSGDIRTKTKEGWQIYFNSEIDLEKEIGMLKLVLSEKISQEMRPGLEYVDLRSDNKVFYKFKDGTVQEAVNSDEQKTQEQPKTEEKKKDDKKKKKG